MWRGGVNLTPGISDEGTKVVLEAIKKLTDKVDSLDSHMKQNSVMLASMAKAVEFNAAEIKDCKSQLQTMKREISVIKKDNAELMERVLEMERYKRCWNLRIRGMMGKIHEKWLLTC